jgi:diguanylate cyclase (GGDEF)-like protein
VLTFLIVFQISKRFTKPILEISYVINRMTDFNFKFSSDLRAYANQKDEIGAVATALVEMHDNYTEFIDQVNYIDEEIKNIDVEKNELLKVELSMRNPFYSVIGSMNNLLEKIHHYFDRLNFLALHDSLTGLPNRRQFNDLLTAKLADGRRGAVILLDLDDFKGVNDTLGHVFGDRVIEAIAMRLAVIADEHTVVSRFGGDEFLVLAERRGIPNEIGQLIHKIMSAFGSNIHIDNNDIEIRFSMGVSLFPEDGADVDQLVMNADLAMYSVKDAGKNGYQYFASSMMNSRIKKSSIETQLRDAIENDGFAIVYQPQVSLETGEVYGYEALLRMKESDVSPGEFVPIAEINGSIIRIGRIVTEKVVRQLAAWRESGLELKPVSINFSANQLHDSGYLNFIGAILTECGIDPQYIEIEVTESIFLENKQAPLVFLKRLKEMGIAISIDDFGTGYSSLNYLTFLPVDKIKLDRTLNIKFLEMENTKVMRSLISLVHSLGLTVIAEGIETPDQVERLKNAECDYIQGFYYSRPLPPDKISDIHQKRFDC